MGAELSIAIRQYISIGFEEDNKNDEKIAMNKKSSIFFFNSQNWEITDDSQSFVGLYNYIWILGLFDATKVQFIQVATRNLPYILAICRIQGETMLFLQVQRPKLIFYLSELSLRSSRFRLLIHYHHFEEKLQHFIFPQMVMLDHLTNHPTNVVMEGVYHFLLLGVPGSQVFPEQDKIEIEVASSIQHFIKTAGVVYLHLLSHCYFLPNVLCTHYFIQLFPHLIALLYFLQYSKKSFYIAQLIKTSLYLIQPFLLVFLIWVSILLSAGVVFSEGKTLMNAIDQFSLHSVNRKRVFQLFHILDFDVDET